MLRLTVAPQRDSVLVVAQTRDRNGSAANGSDASDTSVYGSNPSRGYAAHPAGAPVYPLLDVDRDGSFDAVLKENDIETTPSLTPFYEVTQELSNPSNATPIAFPDIDPDDATQTLWMYFGKEFTFRSIYLKLASAASYTSATITIQYWDGTAWVAVNGTVEGSRLDSLMGLSDQISWDLPDDWFPGTIEHSQASAEGSRRVVGRHLFWVRLRVDTIIDYVSLGTLSGAWEGEPEAEDDVTHWVNVVSPHKMVIAKASMVRDANSHLSSMQVTSRKQPATLSTGRFDFGRGDYYLSIPVYGGDVSSLAKGGETLYRCTGADKNGTSVTLPIPASGMITKSGRYRARVYAEVPNLDASAFAASTGHQPFVPDPDLYDPQDPESQFDPTWNPVLTAMVTSFDVRAKNAVALIEVQRSVSGVDMYTIWVEEDHVVVPLVNQGSTKDYARLVVVDASTGAVIIDTMDAAKRDGTAGPLSPMDGVSGFDTHAFRYTESDPGRNLQDRSQYYLFAQVVRNGEFVWSRVVVDFFA